VSDDYSHVPDIHVAFKWYDVLCGPLCVSTLPDLVIHKWTVIQMWHANVLISTNTINRNMRQHVQRQYQCHNLTYNTTNNNCTIQFTWAIKSLCKIQCYKKAKKHMGITGWIIRVMFVTKRIHFVGMACHVLVSVEKIYVCSIIMSVRH
jgi:hypothetical protein